METPKRDMRAIPKAELEKISADLKTNIDLELALGYFEQLLPRIAVLMKPALDIDKIVKGLIMLDKKMDALQKDVDDLKYEICPIEEAEPEEPVKAAVEEKIVLDGATGKAVDKKASK